MRYANRRTVALTLSCATAFAEVLPLAVSLADASVTDAPSTPRPSTVWRETWSPEQRRGGKQGRGAAET